MRSENFSAATRSFAQGVAIHEKLNQDGKITKEPLYQRRLAEQRKNLEMCQAAERAIDNLDFALGRPKQELPTCLAFGAERWPVRVNTPTQPRRPISWRHSSRSAARTCSRRPKVMHFVSAA